MSKKEPTTRVSVDLPAEEHRKIKAIASLLGISLQEYIRSCVEEKLYAKKIPNDETKKAFEDLEKRRNLSIYESVDDLIKKLDL